MPFGAFLEAPNQWSLALSFGLGIAGVDDQIPEVASSWWLTPNLTADLIVAAEVREWPAPVELGEVTLDVYVDAADLNSVGARLIVTVDGVDTAVEVTIPTGASAGLSLSATGDVPVPVGSRVGVRFAPDDETLDGETLRCEVMVGGRP